MTQPPLQRKPGYPLPDCPAAWRTHRKWQRLSWILFALWLPFGACVFYLLEALPQKMWGREAPAPVVFGLLGTYAIAWVVVCNLAAAMKCPNCGFGFFAWGPWGLGHNTFARKCRNCGLRKWECSC